ncbi:MAG TPA: RNA polymerase sigma factor SigJ [Candidatus Dormibacteraeota bacterium]|nr:RNA polymerase sigma factor SigJ [Candidatus Dormibacteraeota bacterium]
MTVSVAWQQHHRHLLDIAYRMLGSLSEAEDVVQEAFARLVRVPLDEIDDVRGWLVVVTSRLCLDHLRSARVRHEAYVGPWLPEPLVDIAGEDPAERVTLDESVRMALLVVLERLSPPERVAFVLHDVFQYPFDEVAAIMGRSVAACRQLASRARRQVQAERGAGRFDVEPAVARRVVERFIAAAASGDLDALVAVLDPEVTGETDSGGMLPTPRRRIVGRDQVIGVLGDWLRMMEVRLVAAPVNAEPGALAYSGDRLIAAISVSVEDGRIVNLHAVANPDKLRHVRAALGEAPPT